MTVVDTPMLDAAAWQESWDRQQEAYLPDREERFALMVDVVAATAAAHGRPARVLDLAGGTGSISLRVLRRLPDAEVTLVDVDPVLLAIARESLAGRATVVGTDLRSPTWADALPHREYDAVLTATALHWITPERLTALYGEIREVLAPGGVFVNADHMPDDDLPQLTERLADQSRRRRDARYAAGVVLSWQEWWRHVATDATLGPLVKRRDALFVEANHSAEWSPPVSWHLTTLRGAGFRETGVVWRSGPDAAFAAVR